MTLEWEGEAADARAARRAAGERDALLEGARGEEIRIANEFAEVRVLRVDTAVAAAIAVSQATWGDWR